MANVKNALIYLIRDADWMDDQTKSYATEKLKKLEFIMGYPDWQIDKSFVSNYYGNVSFYLKNECKKKKYCF